MSRSSLFTSRAVRTAVYVTAVVAGLVFVYHAAVFAYLVEDDFHWFADARRFEWSNILRLERYVHFYRPVIEIYFFAGHLMFGCAALPFHLASVAIHGLNTLTVFTFARWLSGNVRFAALSVLLFVLQPGYVQAVAWVAAITDLLGAFWYLLTLMLYLRFLQRRSPWFYAATLTTFAASLLTHESTATLLPMMMALEGLLIAGDDRRRVAFGVREALIRYAPFASLLVAFLVVAYLVNSRSYLVQEGYYAIGFHVFRNLFHYMVALYVGKRAVLDYVLIAAIVAAILIWGTNRRRFLVIWMMVTMLPVLFFTWGIASRYLYVPAAGFAMLLADLVLAAESRAANRIQPRAARLVSSLVVLVLVVRFAAFAQEGSEGFAVSTAPYARLVTAIQSQTPVIPADRTIRAERRLVDPVPEIYRDAVAETAFCTSDLRLVAAE